MPCIEHKIYRAKVKFAEIIAEANTIYLTKIKIYIIYAY